MKEDPGRCWLLKACEVRRTVKDVNVAATATVCIRIAGSGLANSRNAPFSVHSCCSYIV